MDLHLLRGEGEHIVGQGDAPMILQGLLTPLLELLC